MPNFYSILYKYAQSSLVCQVYEDANFYIWSINPKIMNYHVNHNNKYNETMNNFEPSRVLPQEGISQTYIQIHQRIYNLCNS